MLATPPATVGSGQRIGAARADLEELNLVLESQDWRRTTKHLEIFTFFLGNVVPLEKHRSGLVRDASLVIDLLDS